MISSLATESHHHTPTPQTPTKGNLPEISLCGIKSQQASNSNFLHQLQFYWGTLPTNSSAFEACQFHMVDAFTGVSEF